MDLSTFLENGIVNCHKPSAASEFPPCERYGRDLPRQWLGVAYNIKQTPNQLWKFDSTELP